ncbi:MULTISPECIES: hypothetical protein [unclassified Serratia (in: enterobacteria)]|uniref:hypothetical protein n=1 Tax=unclassified Serratia (in: enterobacteria) TaxID=2647522 RepID=UPI003075F690
MMAIENNTDGATIVAALWIFQQKPDLVEPAAKHGTLYIRYICVKGISYEHSCDNPLSRDSGLDHFTH